MSQIAGLLQSFTSTDNTCSKICYLVWSRLGSKQ